MNIKLLNGDARVVCGKLTANSVHCVITSPPYFGLRLYKGEGTLWGGNPDCCHEFIAENTKEFSPQQDHGDNGGFGNTRGAESWRSGTTGKAVLGCTCLRCGGWFGQLGLEPTPEMYVEHLVEVFSAVKRVLRKDGTVWLNLGDSYWCGKGANGTESAISTTNRKVQGKTLQTGHTDLNMVVSVKDTTHNIFKPKDLLLIPARVAIALQEDGWYLRCDIIWDKTNGMPQSVKDRPTMNHEHVFLFSKSKHYFYDANAIREPHKESSKLRVMRGRKENKWTEAQILPGNQFSSAGKLNTVCEGFSKDKMNEVIAAGGTSLTWNGKNKRSVWRISTACFKGGHFATFPEKLVEPCMFAGTSEYGACKECGTPYKRVMKREEKNTVSQESKLLQQKLVWTKSCICSTNEIIPCTVLDIFCGSGTVGVVAKKYKRDFIGIDLSQEYMEIAQKRINEFVYKEKKFKQVKNVIDVQQVFDF